MSLAIRLVRLYALSDSRRVDSIIVHVRFWEFISWHNNNFFEWLAMNCQVKKCFALSASSRLIACACSEGAIQLFTPETLEYAATIHYSDARKSDTETHSHSEELKNTESHPVSYPDAVACQFSTTDKIG